MPNDYLSDKELDNAVLFILHQHMGKENAIGRWELVEKVFGADVVIETMRNNNNVFDRQVRDSIERWRSQGQHLCNLGKGYYTATTRKEYKEFIKNYCSAAYKQLSNKAMMDQTADIRFGPEPQEASPMQVGMFGGVQ
jgi:hypothetical protein